MTPEKTIQLYNNNITIEHFPNGRQRYLVNGKSCVSVTQVTGLLNKPALTFWAANMGRDFLLDHLRQGSEITEELIIEAAKQHTLKKAQEATSGTLVHEWAEMYIKGLNPAMPDDNRVINGVVAFLDWVKEYKVKFISSEQIIYSRLHDYVGLMDCKFTMGSEKHKIIHAGDFKTSSGVYPEFFMQVAAYRAADEEESGEKYGDTYIINFKKDTGEFKFYKNSDHEKEFSGFLGLLQAKRFLDVCDI